MPYERETVLRLGSCLFTAPPQLYKTKLFSPMTVMKYWSPDIFASKVVQWANSWAAGNKGELPQSLCQPCWVPVKLYSYWSVSTKCFGKIPENNQYDFYFFVLFFYVELVAVQSPLPQCRAILLFSYGEMLERVLICKSTESWEYIAAARLGASVQWQQCFPVFSGSCISTNWKEGSFKNNHRMT